MEIVEVTSTSFPDARELPNRQGRPVSKHQKASSSNAGTLNKKAMPVSAQQKKRDQEITQANKRVLVIAGNGKRRFVPLAQLSR